MARIRVASSDICLKWNNHHDALVSLLYSQLESKKMVDVTIAAEGKFLNVHRLLLCAASTYFENLLAHLEQPTVVILQTVKFCDIQLIIEYIYKGEVSLSTDQLESFLEAAKCLQIKGLISNKGSNSTQVQEPTLPVEMPITPTPTPDPVLSLKNQEEVVTADDPDQTTLLETEEDLNQQGGGLDVSKVVDPKPIITNQDDSTVEEEQADADPEGEMDAIDEENEDCSSISISSVDEDLLKSDSDEEEVDKSSPPSTRLRPIREKNSKGKANLKLASSEPLNCSTCGRDFKTKYLLKKHSQQGKCKSVPFFRCTLCGASFSQKGNIKRHLSSVHKNVDSSQYEDYATEVEPTYTCSVCSYRGKDLASLHKHKLKKHGGKPLSRHSFGGI